MNKLRNIIPVVVGIIQHPVNNLFLIAKRPEKCVYKDFWEFPGGKIDPDETSEQALIRELQEELDITPTEFNTFKCLTYTYPDRIVELRYFKITEHQGAVKAKENQQIKWVNSNQLLDVNFLAATKCIINSLVLPNYYWITQSDISIQELQQQLKYKLSQNLKMLQIRLPNKTKKQIKELVTYIRNINKRVRIIINDDIDTALALKTNGVHLKHNSLMQLKTLPKNLSKKFFIGASCHDQQSVQHAVKLKLDYISLSPILPTTTHPNTKHLGWNYFAKICNEYALPIYALGGMNSSYLTKAIDCGAQGIAGIRVSCC